MARALDIAATLATARKAGGDALCKPMFAMMIITTQPQGPGRTRAS